MKIDEFRAQEMKKNSNPNAFQRLQKRQKRHPTSLKKIDPPTKICEFRAQELTKERPQKFEKERPPNQANAYRIL